MHRLYFHRVLASNEVRDYSDLHDPTAAELDQFIVSHKKRFHFVSSAQLCAVIERGKKPDPRWIHLSMDDGFASSLLAAEICGRHQVPLTVFVTSRVLTGLVPWFTLRVAALAQAKDKLQFQGDTYDPRDHGQALSLHDAIKRQVYARPAPEQMAACQEILASLGLSKVELPHKLRFMNSGQLRELAGAGVEIGSHGASHVSLLGLEERQAQEEFAQSRHDLAEASGTQVRYLSYPEGLHDQQAMKRTRDAGYEAAFAVSTPQPEHLFSLGRTFVGRGMLASAVANSPAGVRPVGRARRGPSPAYRRDPAKPLKIGLLSFAPQKDAIYCRLRQMIQEAYPQTITVAKVSLNHEQAARAHPRVEVIQPGPPLLQSPVPPGITLDKLRPAALLARLERRAQGAPREILGHYRRLRGQGRSRANSLATAPAQRRAWQQVVELEQRVARARRNRWPAQAFGPDDCDLLLPIDASLYSLADRLEELGVDVLLQLGWGLVKPPIIDVGWGVLSWHHGVMPLIRGAISPAWAVIEQRPDWLGLTLQRLETGMDTGQIVSLRPLRPESAKDYLEAYLTLDQWSLEMTMQALAGLAAGHDIISDANLEPRLGEYRGLPGFKEFKLFQKNQGGFFGQDA